jgi:multiple sugar transport system ATP-binding protein
MTMGDRVAVLKDGILQQCASPRELYDNPANAFVGTFIGSPSMNIIPSLVAEGGVDMNGYLVPIERDVLAKATTKKVIVGVRPEDLTLATEGAEMTVTLVEELGADTYVYGTYPSPDGPVDLVARGQGMVAPKIGMNVRVKPERTYVFDTEGEQKRLS